MQGDRVDPHAGSDVGAHAKPFASYPGSKDAAGTAETIISLMHLHSMFIAPFLGNDAVLRKKTPALISIGIDSDERVIAAWRRVAWPGLELVHGCGIAWIEEHGPSLPDDAVVCCDPPYVLSTRKHRKIYRHEMTDADHARLLKAINALGCHVFISGYDSPMYRERLSGRGGWAHTSFPAMTRGGLKTEHLWYRSTIAGFGVDARYAGRGFRERERIKRKAARWGAKFQKLPANERWVVLAKMIELASARATSGPAMAAALAGSGGVRSPAPAASLFPAVLQKRVSSHGVKS